MASNYKLLLIKVVKYINMNNLTKWYIILTKYMVRRAKNGGKLSKKSVLLTEGVTQWLQNGLKSKNIPWSPGPIDIHCV